MYPELFKIGPFTAHSFGLMLGIGFIVASMVLGRELRRRGMDSGLGNTISLFAIGFGVLGSKLLHLLENLDEVARHPSIIFSPSGLTWYGGFFLATFAIWRYAKKKGLNFAAICDAAAPALLIGYGVARIGCHLSGDGDYGMPTDLPWASVYSRGTYPPSLAFAKFPEIVQQYGVNGVVPDTIPVHPTPIYEFLGGLAGFFLLTMLGKTPRPAGALFMIYLVYAGASRFLVEFLRLNPRIFMGLSQAQVISVLMIAVGVAGCLRLARKARGAGDAA